ncbi:MAG TPA: hypothetical protein VGM44_25210 [Polyangiaceae bacterium]
MSEFLNVKPPTYATDANFPAGSEDWSATPTRIAPLTAELASGVIPDQQYPAQYHNWLIGSAFDVVGNLARIAAHSALQNWKRFDVPNASDAIGWSEIVGLQPIRTYDESGDRQRLPIVLGANSSDSNRTYMLRSNDGSAWDSPSEVEPSATHFPNPLYSCAGAPGVIVFGQASSPELAYSLDHGDTFANVTLGSVGGSALGVHFAPGIGVYFGAHGSGIFHTATLTSFGAAVLPSGVSTLVGPAEFADDGGSNVVVCVQDNALAHRSIYRSTDSGVTWTKVLDLASVTAMGNVKYSPALGLFIAWDTTAIWKSSDGGATWIQTSSPVFADMATGQDTMAIVGPAIVKLWSHTLVSSTYVQAGIAYSFDLGSSWNTWAFSHIVTRFPHKIRAFNGRLHAIDSSSIWISGQLSLPGAES